MCSFLGSSSLKAGYREFDASTKSSLLAAQALGCRVTEIAKSVVFSGSAPVVVILSGNRRIDASRLWAEVGAPVQLGASRYVRESTGYVMGGVPPFPHRPGAVVVPDGSLSRLGHAWASGGAPNAVFGIATSELLSSLGRAQADVSVRRPPKEL